MTTYAGVTYENGRVPSSILAPLDGQPGTFLRVDAADAWNRAKADAFGQTGIDLTVRGWNRTLEEQQRFFFERYVPQPSGDGPFGDVRWYAGVRYVRGSGAAAAIPGTSNHGLGLAVDVVDYGMVGEFFNARRVATFPILTKHGWTDHEGRGPIQEPWHIVYDPARDTHPREEDDMFTESDRQALKRATEAATEARAYSAWLKARHGGTIKEDGDGERVDPSVSSDLNFIRTYVHRMRNEVREVRATQNALTVAMKTLSESVGVDPERIYDIVDGNVKKALEDVEITLSASQEE